jgi:hypothetical protein
MTSGKNVSWQSKQKGTSNSTITIKDTTQATATTAPPVTTGRHTKIRA